MAGDAFKDGDLGSLRKELRDMLPGELAAFVVVRADEGDVADPVRLHGGFVESRVHDEDRDAGLVGLADDGDEFLRAARGQAEGADAGLNEVLDDLHLLLDVQLALGRLGHELDSQLTGGLLGAAASCRGRTGC